VQQDLSSVPRTFLALVTASPGRAKIRKEMMKAEIQKFFIILFKKDFILIPIGIKNHKKRNPPDKIMEVDINTKDRSNASRPKGLGKAITRYQPVANNHTHTLAELRIIRPFHSS
jgi:hypothetical protein